MRATGGLQGYFKQMPVTMGLIAGIAGFSILFFLLRIPIDALIVTESWLSKPWSLLTYPFVSSLGDGMGVILLLFLCYWLYWVGGSTESDLGSVKFGLLWAVSSVVCALFVVLGASILGHSQWGVASGSLLPVSVLTLIWGVRNKTARIQLMMFLPINGFYLALITIAIVFVQYGLINIGMGIFASLPMGIAWLFAENRIPKLAYTNRAPSVAYKPSKAERAREAAYFEEVRKREKERDERERLRKLFEGSLRDDEK